MTINSELKKHAWLLYIACMLLVMGGIGMDGHHREWQTNLDMSVQTSAIVVKADGCLSESGASSARGSSGRAFTPNIAFEYLYQERKYQNTKHQRSIRYEFKVEKTCVDFVNSLAAKKVISVWLDPSYPDKAVIDPRIPNEVLGTTAISFAAILFAVFVYLIYQKK